MFYTSFIETITQSTHARTRNYYYEWVLSNQVLNISPIQTTQNDGGPSKVYPIPKDRDSNSILHRSHDMLVPLAI